MIIKFNNFLNENPDVCAYQDKYLKYWDDDAIAFGYLDNKCYVGKFKKIHKDIISGKNRENFYNVGRIWKDSKIITFWSVDGKTRLDDIINDINKELKRNIKKYININYKFKIDNTWSIEIINKDMSSEFYNLFDFMKKCPYGHDYRYSVCWDYYKAPKIEFNEYGKVVRFDIKEFLPSYKIND
jgi:hypothetical protein